MKLTSTYQNGVLTISISGHIDSSKAQELQEALTTTFNECDSDINDLIIDVAEMTFISSMGLRSILNVKKIYDSMHIINCSESVFNVFKMVGFTKLITIEKALPQMSVDGMQEVPGLESTYQLTDETMLKVYPRSMTKQDVEHEVQVSRELFSMGIPTAMMFDMVQVDDCMAIIHESVTLQEPDARILGEVIRNLHQHVIEPDGIFPSVIEQEKQQIQKQADTLGEERTARLLQVLSLIPDSSALLHGNLTTEKVAYHEGEPIIIDMRSVSYGNPIIDLTHLYCSLPNEMRNDFFSQFLHAYYDMESEETIERNRQNIITLAMARESTGNWDEILSRLHFKMDFAEAIRKLERKRFYLDSDVNIDWVASKLGTNRHYVSDYFNKVLHTTFNDYINNLRLEYAEHLIRSGKGATSDIAYDSGFNNDHTFRRLFKQKYGCTIKEFKNGVC